MTTLYKLTTQDWKTRPGKYNECLWGPGVSHKGTGRGKLCSPGYIHAYLSPELAVLLNPIDADYPDPVLWECEGEIALNDRNLKVGCIELTTKEIIPAPLIKTEHRVYFGILCALQFQQNNNFITWANKWINNIDRSVDSAYAAYVDSYAAASAAAYAAASAVSYAGAYVDSADVYAASAAASYAAASADVAHAGIVDLAKIACDPNFK